jgi:hypothetical protein
LRNHSGGREVQQSTPSRTRKTRRRTRENLSWLIRQSERDSTARLVQAVDFHHFPFRRFAAQNADGTLPHAEFFSKKTHEFRVRLAVHGRRFDFDFQPVAKPARDFAARRIRCNLNSELHRLNVRALGKKTSFMKRLWFGRSLQLVAVVITILAAGCSRKEEPSNPDDSEVAFKNRSGKRIVAIDFQAPSERFILVPIKDGSFPNVKIHYKIQDKYQSRLLVKFSDGKVLETLERTPPGETLDIQIYEDRTSQTIRKRGSW